MKRFSFIFLGALAMLMASCSKHNPQQPDPDAWVTDLSLPVPIQFGSSVLDTKAGYTSYESLGDLFGHLSAHPDDKMGVFGLAKNIDPQDWYDTDGAVLLDNASSTIVVGSSGGYVVSLDQTKYYPRVSAHNYSFYGCYPRMTGRTVSGDDLQIRVGENPNAKYQLGTTDILWAESHATELHDAEGNTVDGYNARYMRAVRTNSRPDCAPNFTFKHVTSCVKFVAVANDDGGANTDADFTGIKVTKVEMLDVPSIGDFSVLTGTISNLKGNRLLSFNCDYSPTVDGTDLGQFLPYPGDAGYDVVVHFTSPIKPDGDTIEFNTGQLEPGKKYVFNLKFNKADAVEISVGGLAWDGDAVETDIPEVDE